MLIKYYFTNPMEYIQRKTSSSSSSSGLTEKLLLKKGWKFFLGPKKEEITLERIRGALLPFINQIHK